MWKLAAYLADIAAVEALLVYSVRGSEDFPPCRRDIVETFLASTLAK